MKINLLLSIYAGLNHAKVYASVHRALNARDSLKQRAGNGRGLECRSFLSENRSGDGERSRQKLEMKTGEERISIIERKRKEERDRCTPRMK